MAGNSPAIMKPSVPIAKAPRANQRREFSDLGIKALPKETAHPRGHNELCGCHNHHPLRIYGNKTPRRSATPRRITDPSACVWPVTCGVVVLDVSQPLSCSYLCVWSVLSVLTLANIEDCIIVVWRWP